MPGPYYASYSEQSQTPLINIAGYTGYNVPNTDDRVILQPRGIIDVRRDFSWTVSPKQQILDKIPSIYLVEREQQQNSLVSSALYYLNSISNFSVNSIDSIIDSLVSYFACYNPNLKITGVTAKAKLNEFKKKIKDIAASSSDQAILKDRLKSYVGIYFTRNTGFKYVLPYLDNNFLNINNSYSAQGTDVALASPFVNTVVKSVDSLAAAGNLFTPGTFIEKPKYYNYPGEGAKLTIRFPLLNTFTSNQYLPYAQNYEFLWILGFQNKPYRTSFSRILPPKLYSVYIPGIQYFPYAYISNFTANFVGTKRLLDVTLPTGETVNTPIPEAYDVSITLTSLLADIGNVMVDENFTSSSIQTGVI